MIETSDTFESALPAATVVLVRDGDKGQEVQVDGGEIAHHRWIAPAQALAELLNEETAFRLMPPTYVSMVDVALYSSGLEALSAIGNREAIIYAPRMVFVADGVCFLYAGDCGYEEQDIDIKGPKHRTYMINNRLEYVREI